MLIFGCIRLLMFITGVRCLFQWSTAGRIFFCLLCHQGNLSHRLHRIPSQMTFLWRNSHLPMFLFPLFNHFPTSQLPSRPTPFLSMRLPSTVGTISSPLTFSHNRFPRRNDSREKRKICHLIQPWHFRIRILGVRTCFVHIRHVR